jgi:hypothetical protein
MSERDELFDISRAVIDGELGILVNGSDIDNTADSLSYAILAAGYSKPRTITTAEELENLPNASILLAGTHIYRKDRGALDEIGLGLLGYQEVLAEEGALTLIHEGA